MPSLVSSPFRAANAAMVILDMLFHPRPRNTAGVGVPLATGPRLSLFVAAFAALISASQLCAQDTTTDNPTGPDGDYNGDVTTAGRYDPYTGDA